MSNPIVKIFRSKLNTAIVLLIFVLFIGVFGFKIISDFSWLDAIYMTVITVTTVGFGEVQPLDQDSKLFTILLILTSVIIVAYSSAIYQLIKQRQISQIKTDFINNMTHEFKTPIATINLALDSIKNPKIINDQEKVKRYLGMIKDENKEPNLFG